MRHQTRLRSMAETSGKVIAKLPDPPTRTFRAPGSDNHMSATALSLSLDDGRNWARGWELHLHIHRHSFDRRYIDESELAEIAALAGKSADELARLGYEYRTQEEVIFETMHSNQRITARSAFGFCLEGPNVVDDVVAFMTSSAVLWK